MTHLYRTINGERVEVARCEIWRNGRQCSHLATRKYLYRDGLNTRAEMLCDKCAEEMLARGNHAGTAQFVESSPMGWRVVRECLQWTPICKELAGHRFVKQPEEAI